MCASIYLSIEIQYRAISDPSRYTIDIDIAFTWRTETSGRVELKRHIDGSGPHVGRPDDNRCYYHTIDIDRTCFYYARAHIINNTRRRGFLITSIHSPSRVGQAHAHLRTTVFIHDEFRRLRGRPRPIGRLLSIRSSRLGKVQV